MSTITRLGIVAVVSPLEVGAREAPSLSERLRGHLASAGGGDLLVCTAPHAVRDADAAAQVGRFFARQGVDALCVIAATWYEDYLVLDLLEECPVPLVAWARPGMETGSLCGMQQLGFMLKELGHPHCFILGEPEAAEGLARALDYARAASLRRRLRHARVGYLGHRVEGMTETTPHELALKKLLGPRVVGLDTAAFQERCAAISAAAAAEGWERVAARVGQVRCSREAGLVSLRAYLAMKELVEEQGLAALAVGCYPRLMGVVCLAASLLGEEGLPVACEGDVNGAVAMLMLTHLAHAPVHNTDMLDPIPADDALVLGHCGSGGFSLATSPAAITFAPVRLMDRGLCCLFTARPGPVTLLNLLPTLGGYRLGVLYGEALPTGMVFPGNPLKVRFGVGYAQVLEWIAAQGLGHHWMAAYGDWRRPLRDLAEMTSCGYSAL